MDTVALINTLDARDQLYVRKLASQGGLPWARAPRMFVRFHGLGLVTKGTDAENGTAYAYATDECKTVAKLLERPRRPV